MTKRYSRAEDRPRCGVIKADGKPCHADAGWGTDHNGAGPCRNHGGTLPTVARKAKRELAGKVLAIYGVPRKVHPDWGLLEEYHRTAGIIAALEQVLMAHVQDDLVFGVSEVRSGRAGMGNAGDDDGVADQRGEIPISVTRKAAPTVWLDLFQWERDHFRRLGVDIVKLGLEVRRDERSRAQLDALAGLLLSPELALTEGQRLALARLMRSMSDGAGEMMAIERG